MYSSDSTVCVIATQATFRESQLQHASFQPHQEVVGVVEGDPGASRKRVVPHVKAKIQAEDAASRLAHTTSLPIQGLTVREFEGSAAQNWSTAIFSLPEWVFKFAFNAVTEPMQVEETVLITMPALWRSPVSGARSHSCHKALDLIRYTTRHDNVLKVIFDFSKWKLASGMRLTADLPGQQCIHLLPRHCPHRPRHCHLEHFNHPPGGADGTF